MKPKILTLILCLTCLTASLQAQDVKRFIVLETLIQSHKSLSNKLRDRCTIDASVFGATTIVTDRSEEYQDIIKTMQKRIEGSFANVQFAADLAVLTSMAVKTAQLSTDAVDTALDNLGGNPFIIPLTTYAVQRSGQCINTIYKLIAMVATAGTGVVLATNEDRAQFCFIIRSKLLEIQDIMNTLMRMSIGNDIISFGDDGDHQRIRRIMRGGKDVDAKRMAGTLIERAAAGL